MKSLLVIFVGGLDRSLRHFKPFLDELRLERELIDREAEYLEFDQTTYRAGLRPLRSFAESLSARINERWILAEGFSEIILVGHSVGGLLLREAYLLASGDGDRPRFLWSSAVRRIVLLGTPNRGLSK